MRRIAASFCLLFACSSAAPSPRSTPGCRERVVSLHDVTTEAVLRYSGRECLVGVASPTDLSADLGSQLDGIPRVESTESVLAAKPTQVFALAISTEAQPELFRELDRRRISWTAPRLERVSDVTALATDIAHRIDRVAVSEKYTRRLRGLAPASKPGARPRVFVFDCCAPPYTAGKRAVVTDLLAHAGADNVFADVDDDWFNVSWEAAVARQPNLIVIDAYGDADSVAKKRAALARIPALAKLPVVVLPLRDVLGTIRSADVIDHLSSVIARSLG